MMEINIFSATIVVIIFSEVKNMKKDSLAFGIMILVRATVQALTKPDAIKSKVLGNALFIAQDTYFPASIDLDKSKGFQSLNDVQKKIIVAELDKSKFPNYNSFDSISQLIVSNWVQKTKFEKKEKPVATAKMVKRVSPKSVKAKTVGAVPSVIYKAKRTV